MLQSPTADWLAELRGSRPIELQRHSDFDREHIE